MDAVAEDGRGVLYASSRGNLLAFDGADWRFVSGDFNVTALASGQGEGVWYASVDDFGYLASDSLGRDLVVSLRSEIPEAYRSGDAWDVLVGPGGTYLVSEAVVLRWDGAVQEAWAAQTTFGVAATANDVLYVHERGRGLVRLRPGSEAPELVEGSERFGRSDVSAVLPYGDGEVLVGVRGGDLFVSDGGRFEPFVSEAAAILRRGRLMPGSMTLPDGRFALGTRSEGLVMIDREGRLLHHLDQQAGLADQAVFSIAPSGGGNVWIGLSVGLAFAELDSPFSRYGPEQGVTSGPQGLVRHDGQLFLATINTGLRYLDTTSGRFRSVEGAPVTNFALAEVADDLLVAGNRDGVYLIRTGNRGPEPVFIRSGDFRAAVVQGFRQQPSTALVGLADGLAVLQRASNSSGWAYAGRLPGYSTDVRFIAPGPDGALWASGIGRVARISTPGPAGDAGLAPEAMTVRVFGPEDGVPDSYLYLYRVGDSIYLSASGERVFRFDEPTSRFVRDSTFDAAASGSPMAHFTLEEGPDGRVWIGTTYGPPSVATPDDEGGYTLERLGRFRSSRIHEVFPDSGGVVWLEGDDELIRYDTRRRTAAGAAPLVREVHTADGTLIYGGSGDGASGTVPYEAGGVSIAYAAPGGTAPRYRTRLEGFSDEWSPWTDETSRTFTNVPPGDYRFVVEAEGRAAQGAYALSIIPPWYRTQWAYALFAVVALTALSGLMAGAVELRTRRLKDQQHILEQAVSERTAALEAAKRKTEEQAAQLRALDEAKSRFFANVSHEFRTPLTLTIGPLEDLRDGLYGPIVGEARQPVDLALRNAHRVLGLINQILDVAKLDAHRVRLQARRIDLRAFVRSVTDAFTPLAERLDIAFAVELPKEPLWVWADREALDKVLSNLLSNAFKFTPEGGTVRVTLGASIRSSEDANAVAGTARITVVDSGPGIAAEHLPRLFDRFYQVGNAGAPSQPGTGIGLTLAKELAELHGGTIRVESVLDEGTTFTVRLPLGREHLAPEHLAPEHLAPEHLAPTADEAQPKLAGSIHADPSVPPTTDGAIDWEASAHTASPPVVAPDDGTDRTTLLVVDDHPGIRAYVRAHFEADYRILEAADGGAALALARERLPDLVISDVMMPVLDGVAFCRALKADDATGFIPVVLLTARAGEEATLDGLSALADDYVTKPFNVRQLAARVENLIRQRQHLREHIRTAENGRADDEQRFLPRGLDATAAAFARSVSEAIEANLDDETFSVEALAESVGVSRSTLYRRLSEAFDQTPQALLRERRLARAARLLSDGMGSVSEVAYAVGFKSVSHFSRSFSDMFGVAPSAYAEV